jgi:hypothetical protein
MHVGLIRGLRREPTIRPGHNILAPDQPRKPHKASATMTRGLRTSYQRPIRLTLRLGFPRHGGRRPAVHVFADRSKERRRCPAFAVHDDDGQQMCHTQGPLVSLIIPAHSGSQGHNSEQLACVSAFAGMTNKEFGRVDWSAALRLVFQRLGQALRIDLDLHAGSLQLAQHHRP